jgi:hypothetical protein
VFGAAFTLCLRVVFIQTTFTAPFQEKRKPAIDVAYGDRKHGHLAKAVGLRVSMYVEGVFHVRLKREHKAMRANLARGEQAVPPDVCADVIEDIAGRKQPEQRVLDRPLTSGPDTDYGLAYRDS